MIGVMLGMIDGMQMGYEMAKLEREITKDMTPKQRRQRWEDRLREREVRALEDLARRKRPFLSIG